MRALILAAGRGSRLGALTAERPKGLVPLCGKSIIEWEIDSLRAAGIMDIALVGGYRADMLEAFGLKLFVNERWSQTNMVSSLLCARDWLSQGETIISYSDIVYNPAHVTALSQCKANVAITYDAEWHRLWSARAEDPLADAETFRLDAAGNLSDIGRKPSSLAEVQGQYMGLLKFAPDGFAALTALLTVKTQAMIDKLDMTSLLRALMESGEPIQGVRVSGAWGEVDNDKDAALYESWSDNGKPFWLI